MSRAESQHMWEGRDQRPGTTTRRSTDIAKKGKRYLDAGKLLDKEALYDPQEAVKLVKQTASAKFDETIEAHVRLGVDQGTQTSRSEAVCCFRGNRQDRQGRRLRKGEKADEAAKAGADVVGAEDLAEKVQGGWMDFDVAVATPDMMGVVGRLGRILGPRGLMPNPKAGTVTFEVEKAVRRSRPVR